MDKLKHKSKRDDDALKVSKQAICTYYVCLLAANRIAYFSFAFERFRFQSGILNK